MWTRLWPDVPEVDIPIKGITNAFTFPPDLPGHGVPAGSLLRPTVAEDPDNTKIWERVNRIPDLELWRTHERRRERLVAFARRKLQDQLQGWGASKVEIQAASEHSTRRH